MNNHIITAAMEFAHYTGYARLTRRLRKSHGCLLTFHRAASPSTWCNLVNRDYYIDTDALAKLLDHLLHTGYQIVTLDEVQRRVQSGDGPPFVNFSIDDVYSDALDLIVPLFRTRGVPVTLFVTSGIPDGTASLWYVGMETILATEARVQMLDGSSVELDTIDAKRQLFDHLAADWAGQDAASCYARFCAINAYDTKELHDRHAITWAMLEELSGDPLVEIGAHSVTHPHLASLTLEEAWREIEGARLRLQTRLALPVRHLAYPYGRRNDCGKREFELAKLAGYATASTTRKGLVGTSDAHALHALPRNTLNGSHRRVSQVEAHLSGLSGFAASLLRAT